jgi:hypothetical protein
MRRTRLKEAAGSVIAAGRKLVEHLTTPRQKPVPDRKTIWDGKQYVLPLEGCPRNVPIPVRDTAPLARWLDEMREKHQPDGLFSDDPYEYRDDYDF